MADTGFATGNALTVGLWIESLYRQTLAKQWMAKFMGPSSEAIIQVKDDLVSEKGDKITFGLLADLIGDGKKNAEKLEDSEEEMFYYSQAVTLNLRRNAVRSADKMSRRRTRYNFRRDARDVLSRWLAQAKDTDMLLALSGLANGIGTLSASAPTTNRYWCGGQTTAGVVNSVATVASLVEDNHLFGTNVISVVKRLAQNLSTQIIRPALVDGDELYEMFIHPYQAKALKAESAYQQAQREANVRGRKNPIFTGALGMWDGVIIHEYAKIETRTGAGGVTDPEVFEAGVGVANNVSAARAIFCGAQAGLMARGSRKDSWIEEVWDYLRQHGIACEAIYQAAKASFNSEDFGVIAVDTAYKAD